MKLPKQKNACANVFHYCFCRTPMNSGNKFIRNGYQMDLHYRTTRVNTDIKAKKPNMELKWMLFHSVIKSESKFIIHIIWSYVLPMVLIKLNAFS